MRSHKTGLSELGLLLFRSLFQHLTLYRLMLINLWPGIHCKGYIGVGIEKELGRKCNEIRNNPVRGSSCSIRLHLTAVWGFTWKPVMSFVLSWTMLKHCWWRIRMLLWILSGIYSDSLFPAVNTQPLTAPVIGLSSRSAVRSGRRASGSSRLAVEDTAFTLDLPVLASTHF